MIERLNASRVADARLDMAAEPLLRRLRRDDWPAVREIYAAGIATGEATFEEEPPSWEDFDRHRRADLRFVAEDGGVGVVGWVAAGPVSDRCVYQGVIEHSVYVDPAWRGRGVGKLLLLHLIAQSEAAGIWTIQSGLFPENRASRELHARCGFREVGVRDRLGRHRDRWRDVLLVERRSPAMVGDAEGDVEAPDSRRCHQPQSSSLNQLCGTA